MRMGDHRGAAGRVRGLVTLHLDGAGGALEAEFFGL
jgi:hypothetical protein